MMETENELEQLKAENARLRSEIALLRGYSEDPSDRHKFHQAAAALAFAIPTKEEQVEGGLLKERAFTKMLRRWAKAAPEEVRTKEQVQIYEMRELLKSLREEFQRSLTDEGSSSVSPKEWIAAIEEVEALTAD